MLSDSLYYSVIHHSLHSIHMKLTNFTGLLAAAAFCFALSACLSLPADLQAGVDAKQTDALRKAGSYYFNNGSKEKALPMYQAAAEQGDADAQNMCGRYYDEGWGIPEDNVKAVYWYNKAAQQNDVSGICNLAVMYEVGEGVEKNKEYSIELYQKALKLEPNCETASCALFSIRNNGYAPENLKGKTLVIDRTKAYYYDNQGRKHFHGNEIIKLKFSKPYEYVKEYPNADGAEIATYRKTDSNQATITYFYGSSGDPGYYTAIFDKPNQGRLIFVPRPPSPEEGECNQNHDYNQTFRIE